MIWIFKAISFASPLLYMYWYKCPQSGYLLSTTLGTSLTIYLTTVTIKAFSTRNSVNPDTIILISRCENNHPSLIKHLFRMDLFVMFPEGITWCKVLPTILAIKPHSSVNLHVMFVAIFLSKTLLAWLTIKLLLTKSAITQQLFWYQVVKITIHHW